MFEVYLVKIYMAGSMTRSTRHKLRADTLMTNTRHSPIVGPPYSQEMCDPHVEIMPVDSSSPAPDCLHLYTFIILLKGCILSMYNLHKIRELSLPHLNVHIFAMFINNIKS